MENSVTDLAAYKRMLSEALDLNEKARSRSTTAEQYYHKKQLSAEELQALRRRKQPDTQINRIRPAVNGTIGVLQQGRTDPKAWPRTPKDENSADVATKVLRYIADYNEFNDIRVQVARDYLIQHCGGVIVEADDKGRIVVETIAPDELFYDPRSRREDFKDARYLGIAKWMYADDVAAMYPEGKADVERAIDAGGAMPFDSSLEDRPNGGQTAWVDRRRRRLLVVELYHRQGGEWHRCVFHSGGILDSGKSGYVDQDGKTTCPIIVQSCYIDDENVRYGVVFDMIDVQDEINKRRSKALHTLTTRQIRVGLNYHGDPEEARREAARPDGILIGDQGDIEVLRNEDITQGNLAMLAEAKNEIERHGPSPAVLGRQGGDSSGRAILARREAGMMELGLVFAGFEAWERRVYRRMWETARQYMKAPDYIRITDDEGAPEFIGINQPKMGPPQVVMGPQGMPMLQPTILGYDNALAELDVDITLDSVPDTATIQQEQFNTLAELAKLYGPQEVPFDDMLMLSNIPDKQKLMERRKARQEEASQGQQPQQQMQVEGAMAEIENTKADTVLKLANAQKAQADTTLNALQAGYQSAGIPAAGG